jgi:Zn-dependent peptidase ImmA (M78 family)
LSRKIPSTRSRSGNEIEEIALNIIKKFQPEILDRAAPFDIEMFFECDLEQICGVEPDYRELPTGIYGYTDSEAMESVISSELMDDWVEKRFCRSTIAHETGHALIHVPEFKLKKAMLKSLQHKDDVSLRLYRDSEVPVYKNPEWQAWRFAGALLMPAPVIKAAINDGLDVRQLAELFQVNGAFVRSRLRALKMG